MNAFPKSDYGKFKQLWKKDSLQYNYIYAIYILLIAFFTTSCAEMNTNIGRKVVVSRNYPKVQFAPPVLIAKNYLKDLASPTQVFYGDSESPESTFRGKHGTVITIKPSCLIYETGAPVKGSFKVELIELNNKADMALNDKPTISNGEMLVTGGSIYVNATCYGRALKINCQDGMTISMPVRDQYPGMEMFLGDLSNKGNINWVKDSSITEGVVKAVEEEYLYYNEEEEAMRGEGGGDLMEVPKGEEVWYNPEKGGGEELEEKTFNTSKFGWINCDAFYEDTRNKVKMIVKLDKPQEQGASTRVYLIFKNINSVLPVYNESKDFFSTPLIPEEEEVYLVALSAKEKRYFMDVKKVTVKDHLIESVSLKECSEKELREEIEKLN